jgi:hypothetical protein
VNGTIDLNYEAGPMAIEVNDEPIGSLLLSEMKSKLFIPDPVPEKLLL